MNRSVSIAISGGGLSSTDARQPHEKAVQCSPRVPFCSREAALTVPGRRQPGPPTSLPPHSGEKLLLGPYTILMTTVRKAEFKPRAFEYVRDVEGRGEPLETIDHGRPLSSSPPRVLRRHGRRLSSRSGPIVYGPSGIGLGEEQWCSAGCRCSITCLDPVSDRCRSTIWSAPQRGSILEPRRPNTIRISAISVRELVVLVEDGHGHLGLLQVETADASVLRVVVAAGLRVRPNPPACVCVRALPAWIPAFHRVRHRADHVPSSLKVNSRGGEYSRSLAVFRRVAVSQSASDANVSQS